MADETKLPPVPHGEPVTDSNGILTRVWARWFLQLFNRVGGSSPETTIADLDAHLTDSADAHDASAISNVASGNLSSTTVQAALNELQGDIDAHLADNTDAHDAAAISVVPAGNLAADDVQEALTELQTDVDTRATSAALSAHEGDTSGAHAASAISVTPAGNLAATDGQAALEELQTDVDGRQARSTLTAKGDIYAATASGTTTRLPVGSDGQVLKANSGEATGLKWESLSAIAYSDVNGQSAITSIDNDDELLVGDTSASALKKITFANLNKNLYRSVTTTDSPTQNDQLLVLSGASFTVTLPTAASLAGKEFELLHNGTSLSQVYTLATTSAQTIGGIASGSYVLRTKGEKLRIVSDGSNWIILEHKTSTAWESYTPTVTGVGTMSGQNFWWKRESDSIYIRGGGRCGTTTAVTGSCTLPGSQTIDTSKLLGSGKDILGHLYGNATTTGATIPVTTKGGWVLTYDSTVGTGAVGFSNTVDRDAGVFILDTVSAYMSSSTDFALLGVAIPVTGWQP